MGRGCTDCHSDFVVETLALETLGANSLLEFRVSLVCCLLTGGACSLNEQSPGLWKIGG